jgi:hypothetical protein
LTANTQQSTFAPVQLDPEVARAVEAVAAWAGLEIEATPIEAGRTNRNFRIEAGGETFFLRLSGKDTHLLGIDRTAEHHAALAAAGGGVGPEVVAYLPELGCLVTRWVPGLPLAEGDMEQEVVLAEVIPVVRTIHAGPEPWSLVGSPRSNAVSVDRCCRPTRLLRGAQRAARTRKRESTPGPRARAKRPALRQPAGEGHLWLSTTSTRDGDVFDLGNLSINNGRLRARRRGLALHRRRTTAPRACA